MSEEVGSGHISIEPQLDEAATQRFNERFQAALRNPNVNVDVDESGLNRFIAKVQGLRLTINVDVKVDESGLDRYITRVAGLRQTIHVNTEVDDSPVKRFEEQVIKLPRKIHINSEVDKGPVERFMAEVAAKRPTVHVQTSIDRDTFMRGLESLLGRAAQGFANMAQGAGSALNDSLQKGASQSIAGIPAPLIAALTGAVIAALPAMGAAISGMLFAVFGGAVIGAGIALALQDPKIKNAFKQIGKDFMDAVKPGLDDFKSKLLPAIHEIGDAIKRWGPDISSMLSSAGNLLKPLADGLVAFGDGFIKPLTALMKSDFMAKIMGVVSEGFGKIGQAIGGLIMDFLRNPDAQKGAVQGLKDVFSLLAGTIDVVGKALASLSATWFKWTNDPDGPGPEKSKVAEFGDALKTAGKGISDLNEALKPLGGLMGLVGAAFTNTGMMIKGFGAVLSAAAWGIKNMSALVLIFEIDWKRVWTNIKNWFDDAMRWIKGAWDTAWGYVKSQFKASIDRIKHDWDQFWNALKQIFKAAWEMSIVGSIISHWAQIRSTFNTALNFIRNLWNTVWNGIHHTLQGLWTGITSLIVSGWATIRNIFNTGLAFIVNLWVSVWQGIRAFVGGVWAGINAAIQTGWNNIKNWFNDGLNFVLNLWNQTWQSVSDFFNNVWNNILSFIQSVLQRLLDMLSSALQTLYNLWSTAWNAVVDFLNQAWNAMLSFLNDAWNTILNMFNDALNALRNLWNDAWNAVSEFLKNIWETMKNLVNEGLEFLKNLVHEAMDALRTAWEDAWNGIEGILGGIWDKIKSKVADGLNSVIDILNGGIDAINGVLSKIGVSTQIDKIGHVGGGGGGEGHAEGGYITGPGTGTSDSISARLSNGEYVIKADSVAKIGVDKLNHMNEVGEIALSGPGGDAGGVRARPGPASSGNGMPNLGFADGGDVAAVIEKTKNWLKEQAGKPYVMGAAGPNAWDCSGLVGGALKMVNGQNPNGRIFSTVDEGRFFEPGFGGENDLNVGYVGGGGGDGHTVGSIGGLNFEATPPHVLIGNVQMTPGDSYFAHKGHAKVGGGVAFSGGGSGSGGGGGGLGEFLSQGTGALMSSMISPIINSIKGQMPPTVQGGLGAGAIDKVAEGVSKMITKAISDKGGPSDGSASSGGGGGGGHNSGSPGDTEVEKQAYEAAKSMNASAKVLLALFEAGFVESGFHNLQTATDHDSLGFLQQRPSAGWPNPLDIGTATHSFVSRAQAKEGGGGSAGQLAQAVQVSAFPGRYDQEEGRARAALKSLGAPGFYQGGLIGGPPGVDNLLIRASAGERVLTPEQDKNLTGSPTVNVYVDGVKVAHRAVVEENNRSIARDIRRGVGV